MPAAACLDHRLLRRWRDESGRTPEEIAWRAGISYPYLRALESGGKVPSLDVLARIAAVYGKPPGDLLVAAGQPAEAVA